MRIQGAQKHPPGRDVNVDDAFSFNANFSPTLQKIKISTVAARIESGEERRETQDRVEEERRFQTDACIVRIMKSRKHMTHNDLVNEATRQLSSRFLPNIRENISSGVRYNYLASRTPLFTLAEIALTFVTAGMNYISCITFFMYSTLDIVYHLLQLRASQVNEWSVNVGFRFPNPRQVNTRNLTRHLSGIVNRLVSWRCT
ncbi:Cullin protein neddylation domain-containing protein [Lactifluus volemus]|nr:Cullin protein neddylation domain-containing protein [Lactifluus volemus]